MKPLRSGSSSQLARMLVGLTLLTFIVLVASVQATEPHQTTSTSLDQVVIPADGTLVESHIDLENYVRYSIVVTGTYRYDVGEPGEFADAQYREDDNDQWTIRWNSVEFDSIRLTANVFDLENHTYTFYVTGRGQRMTFRIYDDDYHDNVGSLTATIYPFQPGVDRDPYANIVLAYQAEGSGNTHTNPATVLGAPSCGTFDLSLGGGWVVVDMGEGEEIADGEGDDFRVYESSPECGGGQADAYAVFVGENPDGPWQEVGTGSGVTAFDLSGTGLSVVRYVRIEDRAPSSPPSTPGADIDAVEAIHMAEPSPSFELTLPFDYNIGEHYDIITSFFDHNFPAPGNTSPQGPEYEIPIYTGEVGRRRVNDPCLNNIYGLPIYSSETRPCIAYDGHDGYDYDLNVGDEVRPAAAGTIINISPAISPPWLIVIEHEVGEETYVTRYGHIQPDSQVRQEWEDSNPDPSQRRLAVDTSRVIGTITAQAGHLHFTVQHNNNYTDPYSWLGSGPDPLIAHNGETSQCLWSFRCSTNANISLTTGGAIRSGLGDALVSVPALVYTEPVTFHLASVPATSRVKVTELRSAGHAFVLLATDEEGNEVRNLSAPIDLMVFYTEADVRGIFESTLRLYRWDSDSFSWVLLTAGSQAVGYQSYAPSQFAGSITGQTTKLGTFALLGEPKYEIYLPLVIK